MLCPLRFNYFDKYGDWREDTGRALLGSELSEAISKKSKRSGSLIGLQQILRRRLHCLSKFKWGYNGRIAPAAFRAAVQWPIPGRSEGESKFSTR
jgi:hypothetical protein